MGCNGKRLGLRFRVWRFWLWGLGFGGLGLGVWRFGGLGFRVKVGFRV